MFPNSLLFHSSLMSGGLGVPSSNLGAPTNKIKGLADQIPAFVSQKSPLGNAWETTLPRCARMGSPHELGPQVSSGPRQRGRLLGILRMPVRGDYRRRGLFQIATAQGRRSARQPSLGTRPRPLETPKHPQQAKRSWLRLPARARKRPQEGLHSLRDRNEVSVGLATRT